MARWSRALGGLTAREKKAGGRWRREGGGRWEQLGFTELRGGLKRERGKHRSWSILVIGAITRYGVVVVDM
jgi:hypothetical protein